MEKKSVRRKFDNSRTLDCIPNSTAWSSWGPSTPPELLHQVLRYLVPGAPHYSLGGVELEYVRQRSYFARLRLVCTAWDGPVLDLLFETILLFMKGLDEDILRNLKALDYHSNLIKSLVIVTKRSGGVNISGSEFQNKIDKTLGSCSKLRELTFAEGDFTFLDRRWPRKTCPGLASTITSLKLVHVSRKTCSLTLVGLGRNLTSLEITLKSTCWNRSRSGEEPIHMPSNMPHLSRLVWADDCDDSYPLILKFVSRIVHANNTNIPGSKRSSPLRCLSLNSRLSPSAVMTILTTNNIGSELTSFAYHDYCLRPSEVPDVVIPALKLCPRLTDFAFESICPGDMFKYLPHTIQRLTFGVVGTDQYWHPADPADPVDAFEEYLQSRTHTLKHIHVYLCHWGIDIPNNAPTWTELLENFRIPHTIDMRKR